VKSQQITHRKRGHGRISTWFGGLAGFLLGFGGLIVAFGIMFLLQQKTILGELTAFISILIGVTLFVGGAIVQAIEKQTNPGHAGGYRKCPFCAEAIRKEALKCKHCGSAVVPPKEDPEDPEDPIVMF